MNKPTENALALIGPHKPKASTADQPLPLDAPAMGPSDEAITIDLAAFETRIEPPGSDTGDPAAGSPPDRGIRGTQFARLAASLAFATVLGVLTGTAATVTFLPASPVAAPAVVAVPDQTHALQDRVAELSGELAALKSGLDNANRSSATQLGRIMETLDRLERRTVSAALPAADATGSVTSIEKQRSKPPELEGWRLLDFYAGRAVLENRAGALYEVGPGSNLPGVGKVDTIKRVDGKIVITTPKGTIAASLEPPRRPAYHLPRGY